MAAKNISGRSLRTRLVMARRMRQPSRKVRSLETEPDGRSLYGRVDLGAGHAHLHGVDGELGLDLELARRRREALDEAA
jgi:hypothetical protein